MQQMDNVSEECRLKKEKMKAKLNTVDLQLQAARASSDEVVLRRRKITHIFFSKKLIVS